MISKEGVKYSFKKLRKNKGRSFLTIFSILVGIATIFIFISFGLGLYGYIDELASSSSADKVLIMAKSAGGVADLSSSVVLNQSDIDSVSKAPGVYDATGLYFSAVEIKQNNDLKFVFLISYDPKKDMVLDSFNVGAEEGRILNSGDNDKILLGYNYLVPDKIFPKAFRVNDKIEVNGENLRIIGFLEEIGNPQDDSQIYVTNKQYEDMFPEKDSYIEIFARVDTENINKVVEDIERNLRKSRDVEKGKEDFTVQSFNEMIEQFSGALNIVIGFVILIALISVLVSTINTANTMITSVLERYKEIGILKAVGAKNREIFDIFLFESSFLGIIAGILGCILGWGISSIGGLILNNLGWSFLQPNFSIYLFVGLIAFAGITGAISGALPARRAAKTNTVDALRSE
jgi:putative ABC transport system permease protein